MKTRGLTGQESTDFLKALLRPSGSSRGIVLYYLRVHKAFKINAWNRLKLEEKMRLR
jgi:hypothetical protein